MGDLSQWLGPHNDHLADADGDPKHCGACGTRHDDCEVEHCRYGVAARRRREMRRYNVWWRRLLRWLGRH